MNKNTKNFFFIIIVTAFIALLSFFYMKQLSKVDSLISRLIQKTVSERTGIDIVVGRLGLNPFKVIELKDITCKKGDISFKAKSAALEHTIWQYILDKDLRHRKDLEVFFKQGCLYLDKDKKFFDNISGRVKFTAKGLKVDKAKFNYKDYFVGRFDGGILFHSAVPFLNAKIEMKPLPDKGFFGLKVAQIDMKGSLDKLGFSGYVDTYLGATVDLGGNINIKDNLLSFTANFAYLSYIFQANGSGSFLDEVFSLDLEFTPDTRDLEGRTPVVVSSKLFLDKKVFKTSVNMLSGDIRISGDYLKWPE
ncbi:MAG: hypothetical protein ABIB11_01245 [Candidatus Omnitrophota bacterium]